MLGKAYVPPTGTVPQCLVSPSSEMTDAESKPSTCCSILTRSVAHAMEYAMAYTIYDTIEHAIHAIGHTTAHTVTHSMAHAMGAFVRYLSC
jgi:hypothetical protein